MVFVSIALASSVFARAFHGKRDGLSEVFPKADSIVEERFFLTEAQAAEVKRLSGADLDDRLVTVHVAKKAGQVIGYGYIETHRVRTDPETFLLRVAPDGTLERLLLMAFYEPMDYLPSERWLGQFAGQKLDSDLRVRRDIHGIGGATLTAYAVTRGVRRTLALHQILYGNEEPKEQVQ